MLGIGIVLLLVTITVVPLFATTEGRLLLETTDVMTTLVMADGDIRWGLGVLDRWPYPCGVDELTVFIFDDWPSSTNTKKFLFFHLLKDHSKHVCTQRQRLKDYHFFKRASVIWEATSSSTFGEKIQRIWKQVAQRATMLT